MVCNMSTLNSFVGRSLIEFFVKAVYVDGSSGALKQRSRQFDIISYANVL